MLDYRYDIDRGQDNIRVETLEEAARYLEKRSEEILNDKVCSNKSLANQISAVYKFEADKIRNL